MVAFNRYLYLNPLAIWNGKINPDTDPERNAFVQFSGLEDF